MEVDKNSKRLIYLKEIVQGSLNKFSEITNNSNNAVYLKKDWENFIQSNELLMKYDRCIENFETLLGFKKELSSSLSEEQAVKKVGDHFAEIDLAKHIIREYGINSKVLVKLTESNVKVCDFMLSINGFCVYSEAKFVSSIGEKRISENAKKSLEQIKSTKEQKKIKDSDNRGIVWIFTYNQPNNPSAFQKLVEKIKNDLNQEYNFEFLLNVQTYKTGLYGDAKAIF